MRSICQRISLVAAGVAADIRRVLAGENQAIKNGKPAMGLTQIKALEALAARLEALSAAAWDNDPRAVKSLCNLLGRGDLLQEYLQEQEPEEVAPALQRDDDDFSI